MKWLLEENEFRNSLFFLITFMSAEHFIVPLVDLPNNGLLKKQIEKFAFYPNELPNNCSSSKLLKAIDDVCLPKL